MYENYEEQFVTFKTMNNTTKDILDTWLKFGTVFLVYRVARYYLYERGTEKDFGLFSTNDALLGLYILLGFTLYFLLVRPYIPVTFEHPVLRDLTNDMLFFGTAFVGAQGLMSIVAGENLYSAEFFKASLILLTGFAVYRVLVAPFVPQNLGENVKPVVNDWLQFGIALVVYRIIAQGSLLDERWILQVLTVLVGFAGYHFVTKKVVTIQ